MSLQGSLDSFALPDVLLLLSSTKKDGELRVKGGRVDGRLWLQKGQIVHSHVSGNEVPPVDTLFELLRLDSGTFSFEADSKAPKQNGPEPVDRVLADAQVRLVEWTEIARVVPHLDAVVDMAAQAPAAEVTVTKDQWRLLRAIAGGRSVNELIETLRSTEFDTCKSVKELVDANLASIDVSATSRSDRPAARGQAGAAVASSAAAPRTEAPAHQPAAREPMLRPRREPVHATALAGADNDLEALAEAASRRKLRSPESGPADRQGQPPAAARPAARHADPAPAEGSQVAEEPKTPEEAKALVAQLAALGVDDEEKVAQKVAEHLASGGELPEVPEGDEPINRGLLLKFLSSVRN